MDMVWPGLAVEVRHERKGASTRGLTYLLAHASCPPRSAGRDAHGANAEAVTRHLTYLLMNFRSMLATVCRSRRAFDARRARLRKLAASLPVSPHPLDPGDGDRWPDQTAGALASLISYRNLLLDQKFSSGHSQSHMPYPTSLRTQHSETPTPTVHLPSHQRLPELPSTTSVARSFSSPHIAKPTCSRRRPGQDGTTMIMPRTRSLPVRDLRFGGCARCSFHWCDPLIESLASEDDVG